MSGLKEGFYWVAQEDCTKTIAEYSDGRWWFIGCEFEYMNLPNDYEILGEVANGITAGEKQLSIHGVVKSSYCECDAPIIRTSVNMDEYCGYCGKDIKQ